MMYYIERWLECEQKWVHYRGFHTLAKAEKVLAKHKGFQHNAGETFRIVEGD